MPIRELRVEKSLYPEDKSDHIVVMYSETEHGSNVERIFKGTKKECEKEKNRLMKGLKDERI